MADTPVYFRFFIDDYLRDAEELSLTRHGVYVRLMLWYYARAKPIPNDLVRIYQRVNARNGEEEGAVKFVLGEFFQLRDGFWFHKRCEAELADWRSRSQAAKASVFAREEKRNRNKEAVASNDDRTMIERSSNQNQNQRTTKPKDIVRFAAQTAPPGFQQFWKAWPANDRKTRKKEAREKWDKDGLEALVVDIVAHVEAWKATEQWREFCPMPITFLNQRRWEDGLPETPAKPKQKSRLL